MSNWMLDIFNRQHPAPQASTMPAPQAMQGQPPMRPPARPVAGVMHPPQRPSLLDGLGLTPMQGGNDSGWLLPSTPQQGGGVSQQPVGGGGMFGGIARTSPQSGPMSYGGMGFGGGAPQQGVGGGVSQMPAFQAPQPMPLMPQQPMPGLQNYNFSQQMGQTAPPSPMNGQMKGMFGVR